MQCETRESTEPQNFTNIGFIFQEICKRRPRHIPGRPTLTSTKTYPQPANSDVDQLCFILTSTKTYPRPANSDVDQLCFILTSTKTYPQPANSDVDQL